MLTIDVDGAYGGIELPSHGLGGWNHSNSLFSQLQDAGWDLWHQSMTSHATMDVKPKETGETGGIGNGGYSISDIIGGGQKLGGGGGKNGVGNSGGRSGGRRAGETVIQKGAIVSRFVWRK